MPKLPGRRQKPPQIDSLSKQFHVTPPQILLLLHLTPADVLHILRDNAANRSWEYAWLPM